MPCTSRTPPALFHSRNGKARRNSIYRCLTSERSRKDGYAALFEPRLQDLRDEVESSGLYDPCSDLLTASYANVDDTLKG